MAGDAGHRAEPGQRQPEDACVRFGDAGFAGQHNNNDIHQAGHAIGGQPGPGVRPGVGDDGGPRPARTLPKQGRNCSSRRGAIRSPVNGHIDTFSQAVTACPADSPDRGGCLSNLGSVLQERFSCSGAPADAFESVRMHRQAVEVTPPGSAERASFLSNLCSALRSRFRCTGDLADLDEAIAVARQAVAATPAGSPERGGYLSNLAAALGGRFDRTGTQAGLDETVDVLRRAIDAMPVGHTKRAGALANLANTLRSRYVRRGVAADLTEAISVARQSVEATPEGDPDRPGRLSLLCNALTMRRDRRGTITGLDEAIDLYREAVTTTPDGHPDRGPYLSNLCAALQSRFAQTAVQADLDMAVDAGRQAVACTPASDPELAGMLSNLGTALSAEFEQTGDHAYLEETVTFYRKAVTATPDGHPDTAEYLFKLGATLRTRFRLTTTHADLSEAKEAWSRASALTQARVTHRLGATRELAALTAEVDGQAEAAGIYAAARDLVPLLAWRGAGRTDQQRLLQVHAASLARDGAACAIAANRPELAVELLEQGRGVLWTQLLEMRTDLTALRRTADDLADQLEECRVILDGPTTGDGGGTPLTRDTVTSPDTGAIETRMSAARRFDELVEQVHALPPTPEFPHPEASSGLRAPMHCYLAAMTAR
jgi:tetratricopeptide (TPR) repeat protein